MAENDLKQFSEDIKRHFDEKTEEVKNHMDVVAEELKGEIQQVAEGVTVNSERLERLEGLPEKVGAIKDDVEVIKVTLDIIKNDLKQKVDRDEFVALERRVGMLETKFRPA